MTLKGFLFLLGVSVATVMAAGWLAQVHTAPGLERTIVVAIITACVVFPAAGWAERRGWIEGSLKFDDLDPSSQSRKRPGSNSNTDQHPPGETR
jgi:hypothetical protein